MLTHFLLSKHELGADWGNPGFPDGSHNARRHSGESTAGPLACPKGRDRRTWRPL